MKYAAASLLGLATAGKIPLQKREMTKDAYLNTAAHITDKFLGGEKIDVTDFMNAQYFIEVRLTNELLSKLLCYSFIHLFVCL